MRRYRNFSFLGMLLAAVMIFLQTGCATSIPVAKNPPLYSQEKLRAVDHWDNIADSVAERVRKSLLDRDDLVNKPLYVRPPNDRPFIIAFYNLLRTRLVSKGMQVLEQCEPDCLVIEYNVQTILFDSWREGWFPSLAGMGIGVLNAVSGKYTTTSDHEIIVNTRMVYNNRYVMHLSNIYYINDDDWPLYISPESFDPLAERTRVVRISR